MATMKDKEVIIENTLQIGTKPTYTVTNDLTDRTFDADAVAVAELADVVATLLADLEAMGLIVKA